MCFLTSDDRKMKQAISDCPPKFLILILPIWPWLYFSVANLLKENREERVSGQAAVWRTAPVYCGAAQKAMKKDEALPVKKRDILKRSRHAGR